MKEIHLLVIIIFSLVAGGCTSEKAGKNPAGTEKAEEKIIFPHKVHLPNEVQGDLTTSMFASEVQYIPLETTKNSLLRGVGQIRMNDSIIAISDYKKLLLFNKEGIFLRQIGTRGKGPGGYLRIYDFELNGDTIYLTSTGKRSVLKYTLDGKFQEEIEVGHQFTHFSVTADGHIVWYNSRKGELKYYDSSMKLINVLRPGNLTELPGRYANWDTFDTYFQISHDKLLFSNYLSDTIWNVSGGKKEAIYIFDLQDKLLPRGLLVSYGHDGDFEKYKKKAIHCQKINLLETQHKLFIFQKTWIDNDLNAIYIHSINSGITKKYNGPFITDDLVSGIELKIRSGHYLDSALVAVINPIDLLAELEKENTYDKTETYDSWKKKMQCVKFDDNPVVAIIRLK